MKCPSSLSLALFAPAPPQVYIIGGDGSMRGAQALFGKISERRLAITVAGVPKTIDNDIGLIDRCAALCGCLWVSVGVCGCLWVSVGVCGCLWVSVGVCGYLWVSVGVCV
jgi:hypothetical protein